MTIVRDRISLADLVALAEGRFGDLVNAVVDVDRGIMAVGSELHADDEAALLDDGRWAALTLAEQLANVGSEVGRAVRAKGAGNAQRSNAALDRGLELFDLTLADPRWAGRRREICRARELVCDFLVGNNDAGSTTESLDAYFLPFAYAARRRL